MTVRYKDLTGQTFNRLTVIEYLGTKGSHSLWKCQCSCGNVVEVTSSHLKSGQQKSCGCYRVDSARGRATKHGHGSNNDRLFRIWESMKTRTGNKNAKRYSDWGGRGISICDEWQADFMSFYTWAITNGYSDGLSIDRIDNNKGYSPDNCQWKSPKEQARNRRDNVFVDINGESKTIAEWAEIYGLPYKLVYNRYSRGDIGERLLRPVGYKHRNEVYRCEQD